MGPLVSLIAGMEVVLRLPLAEALNSTVVAR